MAVMSLEQGLSVLAGRARVARVFLWLFMATIVAMTVDVIAIKAVNIAPGHPAQLALIFLMLAFAVVTLVSVIVNSMWIYRAHANLRAAGFEGLEFSPGWSIGWFVVPIASLFKPFQAMRELWNISHLQSDGYARPADPRLTAWWTLWIIGGAGINVGSRMNELQGSFGPLIALAGLVMYAVCGWFFLQIIDGVTRAQLSEMEAAHAFA